MRNLLLILAVTAALIGTGLVFFSSSFLADYGDPLSFTFFFLSACICYLISGGMLTLAVRITRYN